MAHIAQMDTPRRSTLPARAWPGRQPAPLPDAPLLRDRKWTAILACLSEIGDRTVFNALSKDSLRLTTPRLRLDAWSPADLPLLFGLHSDPRVQAGYPAKADNWTEPAIRAKLAGFIAEQENLGLTKWKMSLRDGTFIGRAGWSPWGGDELEIGYAIAPEHQGCGYAVEVASALLSEARRHRPPSQLVGFALLNNMASRHVLERIGMTFEGERVIGGMPNAFYRVPD